MMMALARRGRVRVTMRAFIAGLLATACAGCASVEGHLAAGRIYPACLAGSDLHNPEVARAVRGLLRPRVRLRLLQREEMGLLFGVGGARLYDKAVLVRAEVRLEKGRPAGRPPSEIGVKLAVELHQGKKVFVALQPELRELALMTGELESAFQVQTKTRTDYGALLRNLLSLPFQVMMLPVAAAMGKKDLAVKLEKVYHDESTIKDRALGEAPLANAIYRTLKSSCAYELPSPPSTRSLLCLIGSQVDPSRPVDLVFRLHYDVKEGSKHCTVWDDLIRIPVPMEPRGESLDQRINRLFETGARLLE